MNAEGRRQWMQGMTAVVALLVLWVGVSANGAVRILAAASCVALLARVALGSRHRVVAAGLLVAGTLPLAVFTWWSIVTPVLAVLALAVGWPRRSARRPHRV